MRCALIAALALSGCSAPRTAGGKPRPKVYWFIPDGLRAEDEQFALYEWAESGELPNLRRLMHEGSYGYSWPVFPGHTPTNYATLLTGTTPDIHGIADGTMRMVGYPLKSVARGGFNSLSKLVPPIWMDAERSGYLVGLLSVPGSTPPQLTKGITIRGRWGGWGLDFPSINFHTDQDRELMLEIGRDRKVFSFGSDLTRFLAPAEPKGWRMKLPASYSPRREIDLSNWEQPIHALIYDSTADGRENYDRVLFSKDKRRILADLKLGEWSQWLPVTLNWPIDRTKRPGSAVSGFERELSSVSIESHVKIKVIRLGKRDSFRIRFIYDGLNEHITSPPEVGPKMAADLGPMVDFVDNYPAQLIYFPEDKDTFLEESRLSLDWHRKAVPYMMRSLSSDFVIQSIYTPNQMLTSRWWMPFLDRSSPRYAEVGEAERARLWQEVKQMYVGIDAILGEILKNADENTYIFFSSDHGALPLYREVRLNNLFARKGWLKYRLDERSGEYNIDWDRTKVIFLQMDNVYVNPRGLGGVYRRGEGPEYEKLRAEVLDSIRSLKDEATGAPALARAWRWEEAKRAGLPQDRVGDLVIANAPGYSWSENLSRDGLVFRASLKGGYKQAVEPRSSKGMLTPFVAWGPGIKAGHRLETPIDHVDQYRTILHLLGIEAPKHASGRVLKEVLK